MNPEQWQKVKEIFDAALKREPNELSSFLDKACDGNQELRREVEILLASSENVGSFMEQAAIGEVAEIFVGAEKNLQTGERFNHYEIIRRLGAGGMGEVYAAEDTKLHRRVALKLLPQSLSSDRDANRRLLREARAAAALDHPHICQIHEIAETGGRSFIVMQFCEGETLAEKIERENLTLRETLDLAVQIADALANAHSHQVIHRDIKPANIIVNNRGQAKILDFGLAKIFGENPNAGSEDETVQLLSQANMIVGTPPYMSPEQARGEPLDARTDIFSFGALLYEMLSGKQVFSRESHAETISAVLSFEPPIAKTLADTPTELQRIVRKSLAKDKEERYQTAKDLFLDLKNLQKRQEFEAELERNQSPNRNTKEVQTQIFQAVVSSKTPNIPPNNLTENLSRLVGREKEIAEIENLLRREDIRLVTMTGVGGAGKTRLAQAVKGLAINRWLDDKLGIAASLNLLGELSRTKGDNAAARPLQEESLAIFRKLGNKEGVCGTLNNLAAIAFAVSDFAAARLHYAEALGLAQELGEKIILSYSMDGFAALAAESGESERAAEVAGAAERLRESIGFETEPADRRFRDAYLAKLKTKLDEAAFAKLYEQGRRLKLEEAVALCLKETGG